MELKTTCIICPVGCSLTITKDEQGICVVGNSCPRGIAYGKSEITCPKRVVTASIFGKNCLYFVKTTNAIPKERINDLLKHLNTAPQKDYAVDEVVFRNPLNLDCDIIVTGKSD